MAKIIIVISVMVFLFLNACNPSVHQGSINEAEVTIYGSVKKAMMGNDTIHQIIIDTSYFTPSSYGIGLGDGYHGELLMEKGKLYKAFPGEHEAIVVKEIEPGEITPFFIHGSGYKAIETVSLKSVSDTQLLEQSMDSIFAFRESPVLFRIEGSFKELQFHVRIQSQHNIASSEGSHRKVTKLVNGVKGAITGFYSKEHHGILTHHNSNIHMHFISDDKLLMGHVEKVHGLEGKLIVYGE